MSGTTILVAGGTGLIGSAVTRQLIRDGLPVRVLTRRADTARQMFSTGVEIASGDVTDPGAVAAALEGCGGAHLSLDGGSDPDLERRAAELVVELGRRSGLGRISLVSGASVSADNSWFPGTAAKLAATKALQDSGIPYAVFRPTFFMESLPRYVRGDRASVIGKQPRPWHWIAADDFARMVSLAHSATTDSGIFTVLGPQPLTLAQALGVYCAERQPKAKVAMLPFWAASLMSHLPGAESLAAVLPFARYTAAVGETGDPSTTNVTFGAPTTTLEAWCRSPVAA